ncbi:MAG: hypothetical protein M3Y36_11305 [Actinomycetota bacterium]|nr:hypothetical protein [Actinomycetota bacterium]
MKKLLRLLVRHGLRQGLRRGLLGGSRTWAVVGGAALIGHLGARVLGREPDVIFSEVLAPGQTFTVHHEPRSRRRG